MTPLRTTLYTLMLLATLLGSSPAMALGLGEPQVLSSLNDPLRLHIPVTGATGMEEGEIIVRMASAESAKAADFQGSGGYYRYKIELSVEQVTTVIITTDEAIREPYINILIEALWKDGKILQEVEILIDPPS